MSILAAHAAVEASLNEAVDRRDDPSLKVWWRERERFRIGVKWADLIGRLTGTRPEPDTPEREALNRLRIARNLVAHHRGVPQKPHGRIAMMGPAVDGLPAAHAYFTAELAEALLADADTALAMVTGKPR